MRVSICIWSLCCAVSCVASVENRPFFDYSMNFGHKVNEQFEELHSCLNKIGRIMGEHENDPKAWDVDVLLNKCHSVANGVQNDCLGYFKKFEELMQRLVSSQDQRTTFEQELEPSTEKK